MPNFVDIGRVIVYEGRDVRHGHEPWKSDGTVAGTRRIKDIEPGRADSYPTMRGRAGGKAFFVAGFKEALWASDGTRTGTVRLRRTPNSAYPLGGDPVLNRSFYFYMAAERVGAELWRSDGTPDGTVMVKDINPGRPSSVPRGAAALRNRLFFGANDGTHGWELWSTDGTSAGTSMVMDINPGVDGGIPDHLVSSGGLLFFGATDGVHGYELWRSDGTADGTLMIKDINPTDPTDEGINVPIRYVCASPSSDHCSYLR